MNYLTHTHTHTHKHTHKHLHKTQVSAVRWQSAPTGEPTATLMGHAAPLSVKAPSRVPKTTPPNQNNSYDSLSEPALSHNLSMLEVPSTLFTCQSDAADVKMMR